MSRPRLDVLKCARCGAPVPVGAAAEAKCAFCSAVLANAPLSGWYLRVARVHGRSVQRYPWCVELLVNERPGSG